MNKANNNNQHMKVFLGSLPKKTQDRSLKHHISKLGDIIDVKTKRKLTNGDCLGYGYAIVSKKTYEILIAKESSIFLGRRITFGPYLDGNKLKTHLSSLNNKRIYVRNLPKKSTPNSLEVLFSQIGEVETAYLRNIPGSRALIGVILFVEAKSASKGVSIINKDNKGVFKKMNATHKYVTNFKKRKASNYDSQDCQTKRRNSHFSSNCYMSRKPRKDHVKPGMNGYPSHEETEKRHDAQNLLLNVSTTGSRINISEEEYSRIQRAALFELQKFQRMNNFKIWQYQTQRFSQEKDHRNLLLENAGSHYNGWKGNYDF